eukprot:2376593-Rhodomonas_salina.1
MHRFELTCYGSLQYYSTPKPKPRTALGARTVQLYPEIKAEKADLPSPTWTALTTCWLVGPTCIPAELPRICLYRENTTEPIVYDGNVNLEALTTFFKVLAPVSG